MLSKYDQSTRQFKIRSELNFLIIIIIKVNYNYHKTYPRIL